MAFVEDTQAFLDDWGKPCQAGATQFIGMLDQPDEILSLQRVNVHSRQYELTYATASVTLARDVSITVDGQAFTVREAPRQFDDGAFSRALLTKD